MKRFAMSVAALALALGGLAVYGATTASATGGVLTVMPSTGLANGSAVMVSGTGFTPGDSLYILECLASAIGESGCDISTATPTAVSSSGAFGPTSFTVITGTIAEGMTCGTSSSDAAACEVSVGNISGNDTATYPISFGTSSATTTTTIASSSSTTTTIASSTTTTVATTTTSLPYVPRRLTVSPDANLKNGSVVKVTGVGFKPGDTIFVLECLTSVKGEAQCDLKTLKSVTIRSNGDLPAVDIKVATGKIGTGLCGTKKSNLKGCEISAGTASKADSAVARITFK